MPSPRLLTAIRMQQMNEFDGANRAFSIVGQNKRKSDLIQEAYIESVYRNGSLNVITSDGRSTTVIPLDDTEYIAGTQAYVTVNGDTKIAHGAV